MSAEHKRPLYAFTLVALLCALFVGNALRSEAMVSMLRAVETTVQAAPQLVRDELKGPEVSEPASAVGPQAAAPAQRRSTPVGGSTVAAPADSKVRTAGAKARKSKPKERRAPAANGTPTQVVEDTPAPTAVPPVATPPRTVPPRAVPPRAVPPRAVPPRAAQPRGKAPQAQGPRAQAPRPVTPKVVPAKKTTPRGHGPAPKADRGPARRNVVAPQAKAPKAPQAKAPKAAQATPKGPGSVAVGANSSRGKAAPQAPKAVAPRAVGRPAGTPGADKAKGADQGKGAGKGAGKGPAAQKKAPGRGR